MSVIAIRVTGVLPLVAVTVRGDEQQSKPVDIGSRRELFVDHFLIEHLTGARLKLHEPQLAPRAKTPRPTGHYTTVLEDGDLLRQYYRGDTVAGVHRRKDGWGGIPQT